jgi:plasmid stabilization system protein ParE
VTVPTYRVLIGPGPTSEVLAICNHIAKSSPQGAAAILGRLMDAAASLGELPSRYKIHESRKDPALVVRSMPVPPYIVYYRVDHANLVVTVMSVRHGARRQPKRLR